MGSTDLDMLNVWRSSVDASLPSDDRIGTRIDRHYRCFERRGLIAELNFDCDGFDIHAQFAILFRQSSVLRAANDRSAEGDDTADEVRAFAREFARQVTAKTPSDKGDFLIAALGKTGQPFQPARQQLRYFAAVASQSPATGPIPKEPQVGF